MSEANEQGRRQPTDEELARMAPPTSGGREVRVGLFVLLGIVGVLTVLFMMTDPATFRGRYRLATLVEDAGGIRSGDPVRMRGVNVGRVRGFNLTPEGVLIGLEINGEWFIPEDSRTELISGGLLGGRTVDVLPGNSDERAARGAVLPGELILGTLEQTDDLATSVQDVLGRVQSLLSDTTVGSIQGSAQELEALLGELTEVVGGQRQELGELTASLNRTASELEGVTTEASPGLARALARADSVMDRLNRTSGTLDEAAVSMRSILGRMERGEGTLGLLSQDESLYRNLNEAAESISRLAQDIQMNPGRYIRLSLF